MGDQQNKTGEQGNGTPSEPRLPWYCYNRLVARLFPFKRPALLVLSYPRSGSSWVGKILSLSPDVAYLREPINQGYLNQFKSGPPRESVVDPDVDDQTRDLYTRLTDDAFVGIPPRDVPDAIENAADFHPFRRTKKRLLLKEINPLAGQLFVRRHAPVVVNLLRHPAAVAESYHRLGWLDGKFEAFGLEYGTHLLNALRATEKSTHVNVRYEDLAHQPADQFGRLFAELGIRPPINFNQVLEEYCQTGKEPANPYEIKRASSHEADKWRKKLSPAEIAAVRQGYDQTGLKYYRDAADWT